MTRGRAIALLCAVLSITAAPASHAAPPQPPAPPAPEITLPIWTSDYGWADGVGYAGWQSGVFGLGRAETYGLTETLGERFGLWAWPLGDKDYRPGGAEWVLRAPGTTRIARAALDLEYRNNLFAHHCLDVGLRTGAERRAGRVDCKPPGPPHSEDDLRVRLHDPSGAPTAKEAFVRIELPSCDKKPADACAKTIPALDPLAEGPRARVKKVDLVLVDDDLPVVVSSRAFRELDGTYIDGRKTYAYRVAADDAGAGISRIDVAHTGWPGPQPALLDHASACDPAHHTAPLGARICPPDDAVAFDVNTVPMPEGTRRFRAFATDPAGNVGDDRWTVIIDRTPPTAPDARFLTPDEGSGQAEWNPSTDPVLPDGTPGSGVAGYRFRHRVDGGAWSERRSLSAGERISDEVFDHPAGTEIAFEIVAVDAVGNVSDPSVVSGKVPGAAPDLDTEPFGEQPADFVNGRSIAFAVNVDDGTGAGVRRAWRRIDGGPAQEAGAPCTPRTLPDGRPYKALCPAVFDTSLTVDGGALAEGRHTIVVGAADRARNQVEESFDFGVDKTPPAAPVEVELFGWDEEDATVGVSWEDGDDPRLADGSEGSGLERTEYRVTRSGVTTAWETPEDGDVVLTSAHLGDHFVVDVRSFDDAGNVSAVTSRSFIISQWTIPDVPEAAAMGAAGALRSAMTAAAFPKPDCHISKQPILRKVGSRILARWTAGCNGRWTWAMNRVELFKVEKTAGIDFLDKDEELEETRPTGPRRGYATVGVSAGCKRGRHEYKATFWLQAPAPGWLDYGISRTVKRTFTCSSDDDEAEHDCLKRSAQVRTPYTRSNFRWNLCVDTNRYHSGAVAQAHHMLPVAFEGTFRRSGIQNIHDPIWGTWWRQPDHSRQARRYNSQWRDFLSRRRSYNEIKDFACDRAREYHQNARFCFG